MMNYCTSRASGKIQSEIFLNYDMIVYYDFKYPLSIICKKTHLQWKYL